MIRLVAWLFIKRPSSSISFFIPLPFSLPSNFFFFKYYVIIYCKRVEVVDCPGIVVAAQREGVPLLQSYALRTQTTNYTSPGITLIFCSNPLYSSCPLITFRKEENLFLHLFRENKRRCCCWPVPECWNANGGEKRYPQSPLFFFYSGIYTPLKLLSLTNFVFPPFEESAVFLWFADQLQWPRCENGAVQSLPPENLKIPDRPLIIASKEPLGPWLIQRVFFFTRVMHTHKQQLPPKKIQNSGKRGSGVGAVKRAALQIEETTKKLGAQPLFVSPVSNG